MPNTVADPDLHGPPSDEELCGAGVARLRICAGSCYTKRLVPCSQSVGLDLGIVRGIKGVERAAIQRTDRGAISDYRTRWIVKASGRWKYTSPGALAHGCENRTLARSG